MVLVSFSSAKVWLSLPVSTLSIRFIVFVSNTSKIPSQLQRLPCLHPAEGIYVLYFTFDVSCSLFFYGPAWIRRVTFEYTEAVTVWLARVRVP